MQKISLLGSTGSIGTQTLDVVREIGCAQVVALAVHSNIAVLEEQIKEFRPLLAVVYDEDKAKTLRDNIRASDINTEILYGLDGLLCAAGISEAGAVVNALVGSIGLTPTMTAVEKGKNLIFANKETLVSAGEIIMKKANEKGICLYPVDSEHSAIFQCLQGNQHNTVQKIYLTASGGPFRTKTKHELENVTIAQALNHPNWSMGTKITIDSSTMMNKGLELIEARWLFDTPVEDIQIVVHPQSIIHSMVEYEDGAIIAQLGAPDMRVAIQYALTYPNRVKNNFTKLDFFEQKQLTFEKPDFDLFPCLRLAYDAAKAGGHLPAVMNAANESAVARFLSGQIRFLDIARIIEETMSAYTIENDCTLEAVLRADRWAREFAQDLAL